MNERSQRVSYDVIFFDLWFTLIKGLLEDPIFKLQKLVGYKANEKSVDPEFLGYCLTNTEGNPRTYLTHLLNQFGFFGINTLECCEQPRRCNAGKRHCLNETDFDVIFREFTAILEAEQKAVALFDDSIPTLQELQKRGKTLGVISNLWPFCANAIFEKLELGRCFDPLLQVLSYQVGFHKPDHEIFFEASHRANVAPIRCAMVGDSIGSDITGALQVGMKPFLIYRGKSPIQPLDSRVTVISSLSELVDLV